MHPWTALDIWSTQYATPTPLPSIHRTVSRLPPPPPHVLPARNTQSTRTARPFAPSKVPSASRSRLPSASRLCLPHTVCACLALSAPAGPAPVDIGKPLHPTPDDPASALALAVAFMRKFPSAPRLTNNTHKHHLTPSMQPSMSTTLPPAAVPSLNILGGHVVLTVPVHPIER